MTLRALSYGNDGMLLVMGKAGLKSSTVSHWQHKSALEGQTPDEFIRNRSGKRRARMRPIQDHVMSAWWFKPEVMIPGMYRRCSRLQHPIESSVHGNAQP